MNLAYFGLVDLIAHKSCDFWDYVWKMMMTNDIIFGMLFDVMY